MGTPKSDILHLTLRRHYFADIVAGRKRTEYRKQKSYWRKRLEGKRYKKILFRNGYGKSVPEMLVEFRGLKRIGRGRSAEYVIRLGRILTLRRWPPKSSS
jgi:hypothetical protein